MSTIAQGDTTHSVAELAWIRLVRVYDRTHAHSEEIMRKHGITMARFDVLVHAGRQEGCSQQMLADAMLVTKGNITQLLDGMERDGLLYRRRRGRTNLIYLTDAGRDLRQRTLREQLHWIETTLGALDPDEKHQLGTLLRKIDKALQQERTGQEQ